MDQPGRAFEDAIAQTAPPGAPYARGRLIQLCCEAAADGPRAAFTRLRSAIFSHATIDESASRHEVVAAVDAFADHLVDHLFLPLKAIAHCRSVVPARHDSDGDAEDDTEHHDAPAIYVFPPSPLAEMDEDGALAAELLSLLGLVEDAPRLLQTLAASPKNRLCLAQPDPEQPDPDQDPDWPRLFARFEAVVLPDSRLHLVNGAHGPGRPVVQATAHPQLLQLHRKLAQILHHSGAGAYIDSILDETGREDMDAAGGTAHLGRLMTLRLQGWWDGRSKQPQPLFWLEGPYASQN